MVGAIEKRTESVTENEKNVKNENKTDSANEFIDYVIERKTIKDLLASVKDGRYKEQKMRVVSQIQQNKVGRYITAIINTLKKINSGSIGFDITIAVTEDLFGKEELDLLFHSKLISFIPTIKL